jgi:hypothetical protein
MPGAVGRTSFADEAVSRLTEFTAVGTAVEALTQIRQVGAEGCGVSATGGAYRVLKRVGLTADAVGARARHARLAFTGRTSRLKTYLALQFQPPEESPDGERG